LINKLENRSFLIIYNPAAGRKNPAFKLYEFKGYLEGLGYKYFIYHTRPGLYDLEAIKEFYISGFTDIVVVGGDGTLNLVVNATIDKPLPISILPTGTGNDFIKNFNIGRSFQQQMETAVYGQLKKVDIGKCNDLYFLNGLGIGYDGLVAKKLNQQRQKFKGHLAYLAIVLKGFLFYKEMPVSFQMNGQKYHEPLFMLTIGNGTTFGGGFKITPHAKLNDGFLDICFVKSISPLRRLFNVNRLRVGKHEDVKEITLLQTKKITVEDAEVEAHMDGESIGKPPFVISIVPSKINLRVLD